MYIGNMDYLHCDKYTYLGAVFPDNGSTRPSILKHVVDTQKHLNKLIRFVFCTNCDMPFTVKRKVLDATFNASLLYGCEAWLDTIVHAVEKQ